MMKSQEKAPGENLGTQNPNGMSSGASQSGHDLLLQLLGAQGNLGALSQAASNLQNASGINANQVNNLMQNGSQSLLLLQKIIQITPEIQVLHQQEQLALFNIQQHIRNALTRNLGQEVISQLVLEYQKTQEQHQLNIQAAIQRKLTMIL